MIRKLLTGLLCLFSATSVFAQNGEQVFSFMNMPVSVSASGVGGNSVSSQERDLNLVFHNPALLDVDLNRTTEVGYVNYLSEIQIGSAVYTHKINDRSSWAGGIRYLDYGSMVWTDSEGVILGETAASDFALTGGYSLKLSSSLRAGISLSVIYSVLDEYTSIGICSDLGFYYFNPLQSLSVGLVLKNMGSQVDPYNETYERMPWDIQLGISKKLEHAPFRFTATLQAISNWETAYRNESVTEDTKTKDNLAKKVFRHVLLGVEFLPSKNILFSLGYNYRRVAELGVDQRTPFGGMTAGFVLHLGSTRVGASYAKYHLAGNSLQMTYAMDLSKIGL